MKHTITDLSRSETNAIALAAQEYARIVALAAADRDGVLFDVLRDRGIAFTGARPEFDAQGRIVGVVYEDGQTEPEAPPVAVEREPANGCAHAH